MDPRSSRPRLSPSTFVAKAEGKFLFLNSNVPDWIVVNESAAYVLRKCDGQKDVADIIDEIRREGHKIEELTAKNLIELATIHKILEEGMTANARRICPEHIDIDTPPSNLHSIHLKLTDECNLNCTYCYAESGSCSSKQKLSLTELENIADQVHELSPYVSYTLSGGEPLLHPHVLEFADYVVSQGNSCALLTNGLCINKKNIDRIVNAFDLIKISIDGSKEEINSKTRGFNSYKGAMKAYRMLVARGANVFVNMTVCRTNLHDIQNMVNLFGARLNFQPLFKAGREKNRSENEISGREYYLSLAATKGVKPMARIERILEGLRGKGVKKCSLADGEISISETGDVYPCQLLHEAEFHGGNIKNTPLKEIYANSSAFKLLRQLSVSSVDNCVDCPIRLLCGAGCRARSYYETGNISMSGDFCDYERLAYINGIFGSSELVRM